jgi:mandelamide amidase
MMHAMDRRGFLQQTSMLAGGAAVMAWASARAAARQPRSDLTALSAVAAVDAMRKGEIAAEAYARALLDRAQSLERLNAFCVLDRERVLEAARAADKRRAAGARLGLLHGLPIPVKDSVNTASHPTVQGTRALRGFRPKTNATVVERLLAQGALVMGKTNLHELSSGWTSRSTFGDVHNPYDPARVPGGSSGGSAAAVAARMAPLAIAEDTLGSIRVPSTMCGLSGLRPTYGRYPNDGIMPLTDDKFDQVGPLARSVEDLALFDAAVTGETSLLAAVDLKGVRIGIADFFMIDLDPEVERVVSSALDRLRAAGATLVKADVPEAVKGAPGAAFTVIGFERQAVMSRFLQAHGAGVTVEQMFEQAGDEIRAFPPPPAQAAFDAAVAERQSVREAIRAHFATHDLSMLAFPPVTIPPPRIGDPGEVTIRGRTVNLVTAIGRNVAPGSCASLASLVLPAGLTADGLPVGLEFDALPGTDRTLLNIGVSLQRALGPVPAPRT